ncbi:hypothetical protein [Lentibacillus salinarum]|uniref:Uncharacterized protein n=1 Tax=Lentibacillus salinarum TaxID=446820 RepID=A0ABW3ZTF8_9BACI
MVHSWNILSKFTRESLRVSLEWRLRSLELGAIPLEWRLCSLELSAIPLEWRLRSLELSAILLELMRTPHVTGC